MYLNQEVRYPVDTQPVDDAGAVAAQGGACFTRRTMDSCTPVKVFSDVGCHVTFYLKTKLANIMWNSQL
jgi:hypothetical protein